MADEPYSKVTRRMWADEKFRSLSAPKPNAQTLWQYLLTGPRCTSLPGLIAVSALVLADDLRWPAAATKRCLDEIVKAGMAVVDADARLIWLPNALAKHNMPTNPSVVLGWSVPWRALPECPLRARAAEEMRRVLQAEDARRTNLDKPGGLAAAFAVVLGEASIADTGLRVGRPKKASSGARGGVPGKQDQEHGVPGCVRHPEKLQEQDQEQEQEKHPPIAGAREDEPTELEQALLDHLRKQPAPVSYVATLEYARSFALTATAAGASLDDALGAITAAAADPRDHRRADPSDVAAIDAVAGHVGKFIAKARQFRLARGGPRVQPTDANAARVRDFFGRAWARKSGEPYVAPDQDLRPAAEVWEAAVRAAEQARANANGRPTPDAEAHVRHWIRRYLDDEEQTAKNANWPIVFLPSRIGRYGAPRPKQAAPLPPLRLEPPPELSTTTAGLAGLMAAIGGGVPPPPESGPSLRRTDPRTEEPAPHEAVAGGG